MVAGRVSLHARSGRAGELARGGKGSRGLVSGSGASTRYRHLQRGFVDRVSHRASDGCLDYISIRLANGLRAYRRARSRMAGLLVDHLRSAAAEPVAET